MFGRMMNNYYYGKSGKGDFRKDDMPETRMQLFWDTLRTRLSALFRLNLLYMLVWIPAMLVILLNFSNLWNRLQTETAISEYEYSEYVEMLKNGNMEINISEEDYNAVRAALQEQQKIQGDRDYDAYLSRTSEEGGTPLTAEQFQAVRTSSATDLQNKALIMLLILFPCIAITGPFTAGLSYVTRNWARDEHAFIWSDFKDAVKANWKIPLLLSTITGALPMLIFQGWITYGNMAAGNALMVVPQMLVVMVGVLWALAITYMHPLTVTYELKVRGVLRNGFLLGIARLPFSIGIRLLHCVPALIAAGAVWFFGLDPLMAIMILCGYYMLIGFSLSRFITASYTNAVFARFINARLEGAKTNQGLRPKEDDDFDDEGEEAEDQKPDEKTNDGGES